MLDTVRRERRGILDIVFLVATLSLLTSIVADELRSYSEWYAWVVVALCTGAVAWRVLASDLFRMGKKSRLDCTIAVDSNGAVLASSDFLSVHFQVMFAMQELTKQGVKYDQARLGGDEYRARLRDAVEAAIIGVFETIYASGWKPVVHRSGGFISWGHEPADRTAISRDAFPPGLRKNPALDYVQALGDTNFSTPPGTTFSYDESSNTMVLENPYVVLKISVRGGGAAVGLPRPLAENRGQLILTSANHAAAGATVHIYVNFDVKLKKWRALSSRSEEVVQWAEDVLQRLADAVRQDWDKVARQERDFAVLRATKATTERDAELLSAASQVNVSESGGGTVVPYEATRESRRDG